MKKTKINSDTAKKLSQGTVHTTPPDMRKVISSTQKLCATWNLLTPLARNEWICWVNSVKKQETRDQHIARLCKEIIAGKKRPCCWPGCPHR